MNDEIKILEETKIATKIRFQDKIWIPENAKTKESNSLSSEKIRCWIRFKEIELFSLEDLRAAFPEWVRYAKSQLLFKINPLIINKIVRQLPGDEFKVLK